ncbi:MAG: hypothetical protein IT380_19970 [Myxococcales bacterium]|nr:hypothetical protein [Myxococcales bacterium]
MPRFLLFSLVAVAWWPDGAWAGAAEPGPPEDVTQASEGADAGTSPGPEDAGATVSPPQEGAASSAPPPPPSPSPSVEPAPRPRLIGSVYLSPMTAVPDRLSAWATLHLIPWVDVQGGVAFYPGTFGWWVRGGPRVLVDDWRDELHRGATLRLALLAGFRALRDERVDGAGFSGVAAADVTYFFSPHLGLAFHLAGGGSWDGNGKRVVPELRLGVGLSF